MQPLHPDAESTVLAGYAHRLAIDSESVTALTGATFARWAFFDYPQAVKLASRLLDVQPENLTGTLFRGSSRVLEGIGTQLGVADLVTSSPLAAGDSLALGLVPGRTYEIPVPAVAGETVSIATSSKDYWDTIAVLLAPDGTPVVGSVDANACFAAFDWVAPATGTYLLRVAFFESVNSGTVIMTRD